jgi:hypothetical protein
MSYIGNIPTTVAFLVDTFSGDGSDTTFTLSQAPATTSSILVAVSGVVQDPSTYSVSGTTLTFSGAPPSGSSNISVRFLGVPASGVTTTAYRTLTTFTATSGQTTFNVPSYTVGYIDVYRNGVKLGTADFTATSGTTVVLASGATAGDLVETVSFYVSSVLNAIPAVANAVTETYINTGAVTQSKLGAGVAGNGPAFSAFASGNQSIPSAVQTVLVFATEEFDTAGCFNNTGSTVGGIPAYAFLPNVAGYYQVNWNVIMDQVSSTNELLARLLKNGVNYYWSSNQTPANNHYNAINGSVLVYLNGTTDYIQASAVQNTAGSVTTRTEAGSYGFSACLVRAA